MSAALRVVLDTNVVLSALVFRGGAAGQVRLAWQQGLLLPLVSSATVQELVRVLAYPKFRLSPAVQDELLADYLPYTEAVRIPQPPPPRCPIAAMCWPLQPSLSAPVGARSWAWMTFAQPTASRVNVGKDRRPPRGAEGPARSRGGFVIREQRLPASLPYAYCMISIFFIENPMESWHIPYAYCVWSAV